MAKLEDLSKQERIKREVRKLKKIYKEIHKETLIDGLIQRAAYMLVTLEDYEKDIDENGYVEMFTQSEKTEPYERERPVVRLYNTMNKNYQSIIKQLSDLLPKDSSQPKSDPLLEFIKK